MRKTNIQPSRRSIGNKNKKTNWENVLKIAKKTDDSITTFCPNVTTSLASNRTKDSIKDSQFSFSKSGFLITWNCFQSNSKQDKNENICVIYHLSYNDFSHAF